MNQTTPQLTRTDAAWLDAHWMPFTGNREFKAHPRMLVAAEGIYYTDAEGKKILDGLSGLWCTGLGHGRREIVEAISRQAATIDYAPSFQYGHPASFALANKIKELTPDGLDYVFFTTSGSDAVETALKIARAYWRARGQGTKTRLIGREKGYHGVNFGGISVGGLGPNRKAFGQGVEAAHLPHTQMAQHDKAHAFTRGMPQRGAELADELLKLIALHDASNIAAVIVEPFAGSAGVVIPPAGYLQRLREICTANNILLIFDEVITGFGRCGAYTGAAAFGVTPDLMTIAKQVTNGTQPLGAVVAKKDIYDAFMATGGPEYMVELFHGYTYSAHPIACAAGVAALDLLVQEKAIERVAGLAPYFENAIHSLKGAKHVTDIRNFGLAAGRTLAPAPGEPARRPFEVAMKCLASGLYARYGGDTIQIAPPFIIEKPEIDRLVSILGDALDATA
ncbi:MAG: aspartate aminotransferase family protein [Deltaproteobacteria bacterium]|nr:MAG: aspartate aminotransferase family protein [Deltaproteobacteria bacterium]